MTTIDRLEGQLEGLRQAMRILDGLPRDASPALAAYEVSVTASALGAELADAYRERADARLRRIERQARRIAS